MKRRQFSNNVLSACEAPESCAAMLQSLKARGLGVLYLRVADGDLGVWAEAPLSAATALETISRIA